MSSEEQRKLRVKRALSNPVFFAEAYIRPFDPNWATPTAEFAQDMMRFAVTHKRGVVMLPPEFMKTTLLSQVYPLWLTLKYTALGKLLRGMLASEEEGMARANLGVVSWHIENNHLIAADFVDNEGKPVLRPDPEENTWRSDAITVVRKGASKDPTWQAKGLDSKGIQGRRLDHIIADDLITPKNAESAALRKRALDYWDLQFETRLVANAQALVCGNFNDARDLLSTLANREHFDVFKRPSVHRRGSPHEAPSNQEIEAGECEPTWHDVWPLERLQAERRSKPNRFRRIHLLDPRAETGEKLKVDWMTVIDPLLTPLRYSTLVMSVDPAPGGDKIIEEDLDYFNISVGAIHEGHLDVIECLDVRGDVTQQVKLIGAVHDRWNRVGNGVVAIGGAKVAMDRYFRGAVVIDQPHLSHKLVECSIPGDKYQRLEALGPYARSGWLRCWDPVWTALTSDQRDQHQELSLYEQWKDFPHGKHDDKLDGVDVLVRTTNEFGHLGGVEYELEAALADDY